MVAQTAHSMGAPMPTANAAKEIYQLAIQYGYGDSEFSTIYALLKGGTE